MNNVDLCCYYASQDCHTNDEFSAWIKLEQWRSRRRGSASVISGGSVSRPRAPGREIDIVSDRSIHEVKK